MVLERSIGCTVLYLQTKFVHLRPGHHLASEVLQPAETLSVFEASESLRLCQDTIHLKHFFTTFVLSTKPSMHHSFWTLLSPAWPIVSGVQAIAWILEDCGNAATERCRQHRQHRRLENLILERSRILPTRLATASQRHCHNAKGCRDSPC